MDHLSSLLIDYHVNRNNETSTALLSALGAALDRCDSGDVNATEKNVQAIARICATTLHMASAIMAPAAPPPPHQQQVPVVVPDAQNGANNHPPVFNTASAHALVEFGKLRRTKHPSERFEYHFLAAFLQQLLNAQARLLEPKDVVDRQIRAFFEQQCANLIGPAMTEADRPALDLLSTAVLKYRGRRVFLLYKSFVPIDVRQCPSTIHDLLELLESWIIDPSSSSSIATVSNIESLIASSKMHVVLLLWTVIGVAKENPIITNVSSSAKPPSVTPIGRLIKQLTFFEGPSNRMLDNLVMHIAVVYMRSIVTSPVSVPAAQKARMQQQAKVFLLQLLQHELLSPQVVYLLYSDMMSSDDSPAAPSISFSDSVRFLQQVSTDTISYAKAASAERNVSLNLHSRVAENRFTATFSTVSNEIPADGSLVGPRFASMSFPVPCGNWKDFFLQQKTSSSSSSLLTQPPQSASSLATGASQKQKQLTLVYFIRELIDLAQFGEAARLIQALMDRGINVFLIPSLPNGMENVQENIMTCFSLRSKAVDTLIEEHNLSSASPSSSSPPLETLVLEQITPLLPLLVVAQSYLAPNHKFPQLLLTCWIRVMNLFPRAAGSGSRESVVGRNDAVSATQQLISRVLLPMLRVMTPSPFIYAQFNTLLEALDPMTEVPAKIFQDSALAPRYPHDLVIFKEQESLVLSSLKRLTADSIKVYAAMLQPALYANPLFFVEKLLQQAIGFDNEYLPQHTRLLRNAPRPILRMTLALGLEAMKKYASEERERCEQRVFIIASFLCGVWQNNLCSSNGFHRSVFITTIEHALHRQARANIIFATEALKAIFFHLLNDSLEHEEQHSAAQLATLGLPYAARWFGRGSAESFFILRWGKGDTTPALLGQLRQCIRDAFASQEKKRHGGGDGCDDDASPVGLKILLHLVRYHSSIYQIHNDLAGTVDQVLLTSAKDFSTFNDLIFMVLEYVPVEALVKGHFLDAVQHNAMPVVQTLLTSIALKRQQQQQQVDSSTTEDIAKEEKSAAVVAVPPPQLSLTEAFESLSLYDIYYDDAAYGTVMRQIARWEAKCTPTTTGAAAAAAASLPLPRQSSSSLFPSGAKSSTSLLTPPITSGTASKSAPPDEQSAQWVSHQRKQISVEQERHRQVVQHTLSNVFDTNAAAWLEALVSGGSASMIDVAHRLFHARALCRVEDALYAGVFLEHLINRARSPSERRAVIDLSMHLISVVGSLFVAYTDSECKKIGVLLCRLLTLLREDAKKAQSNAVTVAPPTPVPAGNGSKNAAMPDCLKKFIPCWTSPVSAAVTSSTSSSSSATGGDLPQYLLDAESFLARTFSTLLNSNDVPGFTYRNTFTALERLKSVFPATRVGCKLLILSTQRHAVATAKSTFAAATALIKTYSAAGGASPRVEYLLNQELLHDIALATEVKAAPVPVTLLEGAGADDIPLPEEEAEKQEEAIPIDETEGEAAKVEGEMYGSGDQLQAQADDDGNASVSSASDDSKAASSPSHSSSSASSRESSVEADAVPPAEGERDGDRPRKRSRSESAESKRSAE